MNSAEQFIAFMTIVRKEVRRFLRIWTQTLLPPVVTTTLYFLIFGELIGERIGTMAGVRYMDFVAPGLIMMAVVTSAYANVVSSFFGAKFQRFVEEMLVSPTPNYIILAGFVSGGVLRGLGVGLIVTLVAMVFTDLSIHNVPVTIAMVLLTALLFSLTGFVNAVYANTFDDISIIPTFVLTPLIYLGGVFYSTDLLPGFWAGLSQLNPLLYIVNAFRYGVLGISDIDIVWAFAMVLSCVAALTWYSLRLLDRGTRLRQ